MRGVKNKVIAAAGTMLFLALVRTNADPKMWQIGLVAVLMYETLIFCLRYMRIVQREIRRNKVIRIREEDARRWAEEWFNPYREVS